MNLYHRIGVRMLCAVLLASLIGVRTTAAQVADCPALFRAAIQAALEHCAEVGRNQVCLASGTATLETRPGYEGATLAQPGDIVDAAAVASLTLSGSDAYPLAVMQLQLNQTDEAADANTAVLLLGGLKLSAETEMLPTWAVSPLEAELEAEAGADIFTGDPPPLAAFDFMTTDDTCGAEVPNGLLIQSPNGKPGDVSYAATLLTINGLNYTLGSTVFVDTRADGTTQVDVLEHYATVSSEDGSVTVFAGESVELPADTPWVSNEDGTVVVVGESQAASGDGGGLLEDLLRDGGDGGVTNREPDPTPVRWSNRPESPRDQIEDATGLFTDAPWLYVIGSTTFSGRCPLNPAMFPSSADFINLSDQLVFSEGTGQITGFVWNSPGTVGLGGPGSYIPLDKIGPNLYFGREEMAIVKTLVLLEKLSPFSISGIVIGWIYDGVQWCYIETDVYLNSCMLDVLYNTTDGNGFCSKEIHDALGTR